MKHYNSGYWRPLCVLDKIDSGLDVDALAVVSQYPRLYSEQNLGVMTNSLQPLLEVLEPDHIHILNDEYTNDRGPELVDRLEEEGYQGLLDS